jgi:hypothetical protein
MSARQVASLDRHAEAENSRRRRQRKKRAEAAYTAFSHLFGVNLVLFDDELGLGLMPKRRRSTTHRFIPDQAEDRVNKTLSSPDLCFRRLGMTPESFDNLLARLSTVSPFFSSRWRSVSPYERATTALEFLRHSGSISRLADEYGRSTSTVFDSIQQFFQAVLLAMEDTLKPENWLPVALPPDVDLREIWAGCIGALDGIHLNYSSSEERYRNRKGVTSILTIVGCDLNTRILFVAPGMEGSAHDSKTLELSELFPEMNRVNALNDHYFLGDAAFSLKKGRCLTPFRGVRYHLNEFSSDRQPETAEELFNLRHSQMRVTIERTFGILKKRFKILRITDDLSVKTICDTITVCALLHNFILQQRASNQLEDILSGIEENEISALPPEDQPTADDEDEEGGGGDTWRMEIAYQLWDRWRSSRLEGED